MGTICPLTLGIQTKWKMKMMLRHGHMGGVTLDVTFGEKKKRKNEFTFPSPHGTLFPSSFASLLNCKLCYNTRC